MLQYKKRILVIDDDDVIQDLVKFHLEQEDYKVFRALSAEEGFNVLKEQPVDLVLCDIIMDGMDGFEFCRRVRESENYRALPFIFITVSTSLTDKVKALEAGGDDLITKPLDMFELLLKVQTLIKRSDIYKAYGIKQELAASVDKDTPKILLVDDDPAVINLITFALKKGGYSCITALSAEEGFEAAGIYKPDLILSDILMPGIDGYTFRKMILQDPELQDIPFVFLTSKEGEEDILDGYSQKVADYIVKTSGAKIISAKVEAIINSLKAERNKVVKEITGAANSLRIKVIADRTPDIEGYEIKHWHMQFKGIPGGDFIDYMQISDDYYALILGDVMGKKWGAWYFAFAYAGYLRSILRNVVQTKEPSPGEILKEINSCVHQDATIAEIFAALSVIIINKKENRVKYSGAGDIPLFIKSGTSVTRVYSEGVFLGLTAEGSYSDKELSIEPGDILFLVTDGILETRDSSGEQYGKRLQTILESVPSEANCLEKIKKDFMKFTNGNTEDDISVISVYRCE